MLIKHFLYFSSKFTKITLSILYPAWKIIDGSKIIIKRSTKFDCKDRIFVKMSVPWNRHIISPNKHPIRFFMLALKIPIIVLSVDSWRNLNFRLRSLWPAIIETNKRNSTIKIFELIDSLESVGNYTKILLLKKNCWYFLQSFLIK